MSHDHHFAQGIVSQHYLTTSGRLIESEVAFTVVEQVEWFMFGFLNAPDDCYAKISVLS